jgi:acyl-CoA synthetase (AMP-forming)/AMP-acid ligase II
MNYLAAALAARPDAPMFLHTQEVIARGQVLAAAELLARDLQKADIRRLLVQTTHAEPIITALCACQMRGIDLVLAHATLAADTISCIQRDLHVDAVWDDSQRALMPHSPVCIDVLGRTHLIATREPATGSIFILTSGTTGMPKVAEHRFERLVARITSSVAVDSNRGGRWLLTYPPTAFAGLQVLLTASLTDGAIIVPADRTPSALAQAAETHQATHISGTPTFWRSFLLAVDPRQMTSLRQVTLGGEAVDQATLDRLAAAFPAARRTHIYASTEAGAVFAVSDGRAGFPASWLEADVQGVRLRVRSGQLEILSPRQMVGYRSNTEETPDGIDGWLKTGDLVRIEGDRVTFLGRDDAQINVGGSKVYPYEVEAYLLGLPGVVEARVRGMPNPISGQVVVAEIVTRPDVDRESLVRDVAAACRRDLPRFQVPGLIKVVERIDIAESGKKAIDVRRRSMDGTEST